MAKQNKSMTNWQVKSNIEAFGVHDTAKLMKKKGMSFDETYFRIFGRLPAR